MSGSGAGGPGVGAQTRWVVQQVHNNNIVLALDAAGRSVVIQGSGVGFGARRGTLVDAAKVEAVFVPLEGVAPEAAAGTLADIPAEEVACARRIVEAADLLLGLERAEVLLLPIADHLHQAVRRARLGIEVDIPLVWEVRSLYPVEFTAGQRALDLVASDLGVRLPASEATAFALHFVSSSFTGAAIERTVRMTQLLSQIFDVIDAHRRGPLDREGQAAARFTTHLRYLFVRLADGRPVPLAPPLVRAALEESAPGVMAAAGAISRLLTTEWDSPVSPDETLYIGLHVHRLLEDAALEPR